MQFREKYSKTTLAVHIEASYGNRWSLPLANIVFFELFSSNFSLKFLKCVGSHNPLSLGPASSLTLVLFSNQCKILNPPLFGAYRPWWHTASYLSLWGSTSLLAHRSMFGSDIIYNSQNLPLTDVVSFGLSLPTVISRAVFINTRAYMVRIWQLLHTIF